MTTHTRTTSHSAEIEVKLKNKLQRAVAAKEGVEAKDSNLGKALRRRIDFFVSTVEMPQ